MSGPPGNEKPRNFRGFYFAIVYIIQETNVKGFMGKLSPLINPAAVRNIRILGYWNALDKHTDLKYDEKIRKTSENFHLGESTISDILRQLRSEYPEWFE